MGYRSDVAFVIHFASGAEPEKAFADYQKFKKYVTEELKFMAEDRSTPKHDAMKYFNYANLLSDTWLTEEEYFGWNDEDMIFVLNNSDVKWYESYPEVQFFELMLGHAQQYSTAGQRFVRFGEDITDTDINDYTGPDYDSDICYWDMLQLERSFELSPDREQLTHY